MSAQICGLCGRLLGPMDNAAWTAIGGFTALYCQSCREAHGREFGLSGGRIPGKSARQEIGAARRGLNTRPNPATAGRRPGGEVKAEPELTAGENPAATPTAYHCKYCGAPATHEVPFLLDGWQPCCAKCANFYHFWGMRPIAPAPTPETPKCPKCGSDRVTSIDFCCVPRQGVNGTPATERCLACTATHICQICQDLLASGCDACFDARPKGAAK